MKRNRYRDERSIAATTYHAVCLPDLAILSIGSWGRADLSSGLPVSPVQEKARLRKDFARSWDRVSASSTATSFVAVSVPISATRPLTALRTSAALHAWPHSSRMQG